MDRCSEPCGRRTGVEVSTAGDTVQVDCSTQWGRRVKADTARRLKAEAAAAEEREGRLDRLLAERTRTKRLERRCERELARAPVQWSWISIDDVGNNHDKVAPGILYGLDFPWTEDMLESFGAGWLTQAFHATGVLSPDNAVTRVVVERKIKVTGGNNAGKFLFEVEYAQPQYDLHTKLFAKCPFAMTKETKTDRYSSSVYKQPMDFYEINTYRLLEAALPVDTPKFYYGDISNKTSNFILITARIPFAEMGCVGQRARLQPHEVEGPYSKCKDYQLRGPAREYYLLLVRVIARIAGHHKAGRLGSAEALAANLGVKPAASNIEAWGVNPAGPSGEDPSLLASKLDTAIRFMSDTARAVFPAYAAEGAFQLKFRAAMLTWSAYSAEIEYWKNLNQDYVAFGHQNLNTDNGYFWRGGAGQLECGAFDWGGFATGNVGHLMWWCFNCADFDQLKRHLPEYIDVFITTYHAHGGPRLDHKILEMMISMTCLSNTNFMVGAVPNCFRMCAQKEWATIKDRHDKRIANDIDGKSTLRTTLHVLNNGCRVLEELKCDEMLERWIDEVWVGQFKQERKTPDMIAGGNTGLLFP